MYCLTGWGADMTIIDYIILALAALCGVGMVAFAIVIFGEDCEHILTRGRGQGHE